MSGNVTIDGYRGVAFYKPWTCTEGHGDRCVVAVMVGDDHPYHVDAGDVHPLADDAFCGQCGQIGCGHG